METRGWIIIDCRTEKALYGVERKTLRFSTREIAEEVARQFFLNGEDFTLFSVDSIQN